MELILNIYRHFRHLPIHVCEKFGQKRWLKTFGFECKNCTEVWKNAIKVKKRDFKGHQLVCGGSAYSKTAIDQAEKWLIDNGHSIEGLEKATIPLLYNRLKTERANNRE